jgi:hypothetical protein
VTICPCCGFKSEVVLNSVSSDGCSSCGARSVGEPLPRPERELPSYGRSLLLAVMGTLMVLTFLTQTFVALTQRASRGAKTTLAFFSMIPFDVALWFDAAQTAAWRLKWVMIPATIFVLWSSRKLYRSIVQSPARFCGRSYARNGYLASALVPLVILILIGVSVPKRLALRQDGIDAGANALAYTFNRAIFEYSVKFERVPNELNDLRQLPDADGSIAAALNSFDPAMYPNAYRPSAEIAAKQKPSTLRGAVIRHASLSTSGDETLNEGLSFTNYDLRLPGPDKLMGTEDDLILRDGVITKAADAPRRGGTGTVTKNHQP